MCMCVFVCVCMCVCDLPYVYLNGVHLNSNVVWVLERGIDLKQNTTTGDNNGAKIFLIFSFPF